MFSLGYSRSISTRHSSLTSHRIWWWKSSQAGKDQSKHTFFFFFGLGFHVRRAAIEEGSTFGRGQLQSFPRLSLFLWKTNGASPGIFPWRKKKKSFGTSSLLLLLLLLFLHYAVLQTTAEYPLQCFLNFFSQSTCNSLHDNEKNKKEFLIWNLR